MLTELRHGLSQCDPILSLLLALSRNKDKEIAMLKNLLAAIGLFVVSRKGYEWYTEFQDLKERAARAEEQHKSNTSGGDHAPS